MPSRMGETNKQEPFPATDQVRTAVVTGEHPFDVPSFHNMFRSMPEVDYYPQHMDQFVSDWGKVRTRYDVVVFYKWHLDTPPDNERSWLHKGIREAMEQLGETGQGILVLHHAITAFPQWEFWSALAGIPHARRELSLEKVTAAIADGTAALDTLRIEISDPDHPIIHGLSAWSMRSETWGSLVGDPMPECHVVLTTDHPKSALKAMAWTHEFRKARVFCLQPGHDKNSFADPSFRRVLSRGIQWVAQRL